MKKYIFLVLVLISSVTTATIAFANNSTNLNSKHIDYSADSGPEFVDSVEAQDMYGMNTKWLKIWKLRLANGKYYFYATTKGQDVRYDIQYADNNKYKPFYVKIKNERWYFQSRELDYASGYTDQW